MAKIDRFLSLMLQKGAPVLRLDPGDQPVLEFPGGHRQLLPGMELLGTVLDGLAKELIPETQETAYLRGEKVSVEYALERERFQVLFLRSSMGPRILVGRLGPVGAASAKEGSEVRLEAFVQRLLAAGGSDLYLNCGETPVMRLDGRLERIPEAGPFGARELEELVKPWVPLPCLEAFQAGQDAVFMHVDAARLCRQRVSLVHDACGPSISIRVVPHQVPEAARLGLDETLQRLAYLHQGLVLLTGPSGSGRSTTSAALIELAHRTRRDHLVSIQDATEFELQPGGCLLRQVEVGRDLARRKRAIRAALHQGPDLLAMGELEDAELVELALQAARSGCVVFATLQSTSLPDTFYTLVDAFPAERQGWARNRLAESLRAIVGHTLLRAVGEDGVAAFETLFKTPGHAALIREGAFERLGEAMKGGRYGQVSHTEALLRLIQAGRVEAMEAYRVCQDREAFISACKKAGLAFDPRCEGQKVTEE